VGLRKVIGNEEIEQVYDVLRDQNHKVDRQTWNRRYRRYVEKINTGSLFDIAEVLRDLSRLKYTKSLSFGERKMLDQARTLLVKELSVARRLSEEDVADELDQLIATEMGGDAGEAAIAS
jgi:CarD family transcriptional regulator